MLRKQIWPAISVTMVLMMITGLLYPAAVTGIAQSIFPHQANGSLVTADGRVIGSSLIGQSFAGAEYFHPRRSAAGAGYDDTLSAGTNKGPTDRKLTDTLVAAMVDSAVATDGGVRGQIPSDMATTSASGLDPHISPANAALQVGRVASARGVGPETVRQLVTRYTEGRQFGFLGDPRVNVLRLNLALDSTFGGEGALRNKVP
ncbi:MAG TPA: potassium-transporting ATPase subunit KdpC [Gemmatimonadaceae bacterium]|jgi:K+-transporting ATPase ATPase C chain|nr:potassium-transporting ATPase subunit KdpC [Gemmatimonadaceae bacterium]